jgi:tungstate transport system substrate-binding protein
MIRVPARLALFLIAAVALLAACGSDSSNNTAATATSRATPAASAASATTAPQAAATTAPTQRPKPARPDIIVSTTTSTVDSGLLDVLQPAFEQQTGYKLTILSQGSGAALKTGERGEADVVLAHSPDAEKQFMDGGNGTRRELVMHNDFIIVGPAKDPAGIKSATDINDAMKRMAASNTPFISRGDDSGTNALELKLWQAAGINPKGQGWYQESGSGMGQTLQIASDKAGYTIADRATYLNLKKNLSLDILVENKPSLLNVYHVIQVDPKKSPKVNGEGAQAFIEWLISPATQKLIGDYGKDRFGQPLFVPDYGKDESRLGA